MKLEIVDLFAGAGGSLTGVVQSLESRGIPYRITAINHNEDAVSTLSANYPHGTFICSDIDLVSPTRLCPDGIDILWASPSCVNHSIAKGAMALDEQDRSSAWCVLRWAEHLKPRVIFVENVWQFVKWGDLDANKRPDKASEGKLFESWCNCIASLGYRIEYRILNCADYGDPTTRKRFFMIASRQKPVFPEAQFFPRHENPEKRWRPASSVIDWSDLGLGIWDRPKPLCKATLNRLEDGIRKHWGEYAEPFITILRGKSKTRSIHDPLPTITTSGAHFGLCVGQQSCAAARPTSEPLPTIATAGAIGLCQPLINVHRNHGVSRPVDEPLQTITAGGNHFGVCTPLIVPYNGNAWVTDVNEPLPTITSVERLSLLHTSAVNLMYRMLRWPELAAGMSFPEGYKFKGNQRSVIRQIGNAVPIKTAQALADTMLRRLIA